jgi:uncharacterized protein (TIGR03437 family)
MRIGRILLPLVTILQAAANAQFTPAAASPFSAGAGPSSVAVGDFNEDGIQDLAIANFGGNNVTVLLGNGTGGFTPATGNPFKVGSEPVSVAVGNFNGHAGLAIANEGANTITVLVGDGKGGFTQGSPFTVGSEPISVVVGDLNGDGIQDLVVANFGSKNVSVLMGIGGGGFMPASNFIVGNNPSTVAVGDFNGDGKLDLAIANKGSNTVTVLLANATGGFSEPLGSSPIAVGSAPVSVAVGDFNNDGKLDLVVANEGANNVSVLLGNAMGGFAPDPGSSAFPVGSVPFSVTVGDFNMDGKPDLAIVNEGDNTVTVLLGNGMGGFTPAAGSPFAVGSAPVSVAIGDFNGDGKLDLAIANKGSNTVTVLLNNIYSPATVSAASYTAPVALGSIVSIYGSNLAAAATQATGMPLPFILGGTSVTITYSNGAQAALRLLYAGPTQINAQIPQSAGLGLATLTVSTASGSQSGPVMLTPVAPGLFSANGTGQGVAAAQFVAYPFLAVANVFQCLGAAATCLTVPIDVSAGNSQLVLYGTGIHNAALSQVMVTVGNQTLQAVYAGAAPNNAGEDQVNVALPASLAHSGLVQVSVSVAGMTANGIVAPTMTSNFVTIYIQ